MIMVNITYQIMRLLYTVLNNNKLGRNLKSDFDSYLDKIFYVLRYGIPWSNDLLVNSLSVQ